MSYSTFFLVCLQVVLIQNAYSQCLNRFGAPGYSGLAFEAEAVSSGLGALNGYGPFYGATPGLVGSGFDAYGYGINGLNGIGYGINGLNGIGYGINGLNGIGYGINELNGIGYGINGLNGIGYGINGLNGIGYGNGLAYGAYGAGVPSVAATAAVPVTGPFVSNGFGELAVGGDFAVGGTTVVGGQIPVIGAVSFGGQIPAGGVVSIAGNCGCASVPL